MTMILKRLIQALLMPVRCTGELVSSRHQSA